MIEQAELQPGDRVLEIGSGGYQAALLAEIVTPTGTVVTLDIDPEITDRAAKGLERTGQRPGNRRARRRRARLGR